MKDERLLWLDKVLDSLKFSEVTVPLSSKDIVRLIEQHLKSPHSSRLPVLGIPLPLTEKVRYNTERSGLMPPRGPTKRKDLIYPL